MSHEDQDEGVVDKATQGESIVGIVVDRDECNRPDTTM